MGFLCVLRSSDLFKVQTEIFMKEANDAWGYYFKRTQARDGTSGVMDKTRLAMGGYLLQPSDRYCGVTYFNMIKNFHNN